MTNVFVGFHDQRSSSRILKPPGGGTSDIFGTESPPKVIESVEPSVSTNLVEVEKKPKIPEPAENGQKPTEKSVQEKPQQINEIKEAVEVKIDTLTISEEKKEETAKTPEYNAPKQNDSVSSLILQDDVQINTPKKSVKSPNRVPPGGYSSGLW